MGTRELAATVPSVFHDDGALDPDGQLAVTASYVAAGCTWLLALAASGGEPDSLDPDERDQVARTIRQGASGTPVIVGVGIVDAGTVARAHRAGGTGASGVLVTVSSAGPRIAERLAEVAEVGLPLWLHVVGAGRDGVRALAAELRIEATVIEAAPSPDLVAGSVAGGQRAFGGLGGLFLPEELEAGATGTVAASAIPERMMEVLNEAPPEGPVPLDAYVAVLPYLRLEAGSTGTIVRKEAWRQRGILASGRTRRGHPLDATMKRAITRRLRDVGMSPTNGYPGA